MKLTDEMFEQMLHEAAEKAAEMLERSLPDMDERQLHEFSPRFHRRMRRIMRRRKRSHSIRILKRAAVVVLCIGLSIFGLSMTAEASRVEFFKVITKVRPEWTELKYKSNGFDAKFVPCELTYIPKGLNETSRTENGSSIIIDYYSPDNSDYLFYDQFYLLDSCGTFGYDSEDAEIETVQVNGEDATFVSEFVAGQMRYMLIWTDWGSRYSICSNLPKDELIKAGCSVRAKTRHSSQFTERKVFDWVIDDSLVNLPFLTEHTSHDFMRLMYTGKNGKYLNFFRFPSDSTGYKYDLTNAETVQLDKDAHASLITDEDKQILVWHDGDFEHSIISNLSKDELLQVANNVQIYEVFTYSGQNTEEFIESKPYYLPEGMKRTAYRKHDAFSGIRYENENDYLEIEQGFSVLSSQICPKAESVDLLPEQSGSFISKNGVSVLTWSYENYTYTITSSLPKDELIKIAKNIH